MKRMLSRIGFGAVVAALGAIAWFGLAVPYRAHLANAAAGEEATASLIERYRTMEAAPPESAQDDAALLLPELSEAQTTAFLQQMVQRLATAGGVEIAGMQVLPGEDEAALRRVSLRIRGSAGIEAVSAFLHALETARPLVLVDTVRLQGRVERGERKLDLQLDAIGFRPRPPA